MNFQWPKVALTGVAQIGFFDLSMGAAQCNRLIDSGERVEPHDAPPPARSWLVRRDPDIRPIGA